MSKMWKRLPQDGKGKPTELQGLKCAEVDVIVHIHDLTHCTEY